MKNVIVIGFIVTMCSALTATFGHYWSDLWIMTYPVAILLGIVTAGVLGDFQ